MLTRYIVRDPENDGPVRRYEHMRKPHTVVEQAEPILERRDPGSSSGIAGARGCPHGKCDAGLTMEAFMAKDGVCGLTVC